MKLKNIDKLDLENMSYDDIAYLILKEKGKKIKTADLFKSVCETLNLSDKEYEEKIGDFFTLLATEKRFLQLDKGYWDLRENHQVKIDIKDDEEPEESLDDEIDEESDGDEEAFYDDTKEADDDDEDDELKDLVIVDEDSSEEI